MGTGRAQAGEGRTAATRRASQRSRGVARASRKPLAPPQAPRNASAPHGGKVAALEGLRALSIVAVVLYHAAPTTLPGGFFGVTVFFVLTGYLTTLSIERELEREGSFDYLGFVLRRLRRLAPSVVVVVGATVLLCALFSHALLPKVKTDALSALLFFENIHYIIADVPYFAAAGLPSPLTHLWFLGVTMQFYLVWPLALLVLRRLCPRREVLLGVVGALALASAVAMAALYDPANTSRVYYGPDTRAAELLAGALCALVTQGRGWELRVPARLAPGRPPVPRWAYDASGCAALALLALMALLVDGYSPAAYHGGLLVAALLSAVLVGTACRRQSLLARLLGCRALVALGGLSFSLYLWHYPLLLVMNPATRTTELPWWAWVLELALILVVSVAARALMEGSLGTPWRHGQTRARAAALGASALAVLALWAVPVDASAGRPETPAHVQSSEQPGETDANALGEGQAVKDAQGSEGDDAPPAPEDYEVDPESGATDAKVLLIGDSVSLDTLDRFDAVFPNGWMDSAISRQIYVGTDVYRSCVEAGHEAPVVIFSLGTNGPVTEDDVRGLIDECGSNRRVLLVNNRMPDAFQDRNNAVLEQVASEYDNVELVDWFSESAGHDEYFWDDGTHLRPEGIDAYVAMLRRAVTGR